MHYLSNSRRLARALKPLVLFEADVRFVSNASHAVDSLQSSNHRSPPASVSPDNNVLVGSCARVDHVRKSCRAMSLECSWATSAVLELHGKILDSVNVKRSMPPNAWLWSLMENCRRADDATFLFDALQNLRRFRLSNLRIHANFNSNLCQQIAKTCARVDAMDYGKRTLWKHNVYGLTPSVASAHQLLSHCLMCWSTKQMRKIMKLMKASNLPLQPGTADLVFRICHASDNWVLLAKYSKIFCKAGVKLRKTTFDVWMELAAKRGETEALWNADKLRSETYPQHTLSAAFSCAKGFLLEHKPEEAAAVIQSICQAYPDENKSALEAEFKKLVNEWPVDVIKHQKEEDKKKAVAASLKSGISAMVDALVNSGSRVSVDLDVLNKNEGLLSC